MEKKKTVKKSSVKKTKSPAFIVDITGAHTASDIYTAFALAKQEAGLPISDIELTSLIDEIVKEATEITVGICSSVMHLDWVTRIELDRKEEKALKEEKKEKKPWYKRFWNWITRKK